VFSQRERRDLSECLVAAARVDERITAAAVVGSVATHREDEWSDIDLAFRLATGLEPADVGDAWTGPMYEDHGAVDHLDVWSESTLFRVFLLSSSMQVDLSFWPWETFAASGTSFRLLFGEANKPRPPSPPTPEALIGMGWLYAFACSFEYRAGPQSAGPVHGQWRTRSCRLARVSASWIVGPPGPWRR